MESLRLKNVTNVDKSPDAAEGDYGMDEKGAEARGAMNDPYKASVLRRLRERNMLVPGSGISQEIKNEIRRIKRPLLSNAYGKNATLVDQGNLILVVSSVPGEGKTYVSLNLALALSQERDNTVLLIDCDVTKQGTSRFLGVEKRRPNITDLLADSGLHVSDAILATDVPGLSVLPAGKPHEYITEMVSSIRMREILEEISAGKTNQIVILDAPPLLSTPESQVLASLVGQIVFVIEAGKTPHSIVEDALEMLPKEKAIGLVLNKSDSLTSRGGYYYNYYKPYGEKDE